MASKYVIAAGGNWDDDTTWSTSSGGSNDTTKPTAADDVFLDASSGNVTINAASVCRSINCTGYTGTLTHNTAISLTIGDATAGASDIALKFVAGMTYTRGNSTVAITFVSTSATQQTVDFAGKTTGAVTFNSASGGSYILSSALSSGDAFGSITLTKGTLNTNGQTLSVGKFQCNSGLTRALTLGASQITLTGTDGWQFTSGGLTLSAASSTIIFGTHTSARTFAGSGGTYGTLSYIVNGSTGMLTISGSNTFDVINFTDTTNARTLRITASTTQTILTTFNVNGTASKLMSIDTQTAGTPAVLSKASGTINCTYVSIKDSTAQGGATWNADINSVNVSGNTGWVFESLPSSFVSGRGSDEAEYAFLAAQNSVYSGSLNEQRLRFYNSEISGNYNTVSEAEMAFLKSKTGKHTINSLADLWRDYLKGLSIADCFSIDEMKQVWWSGSTV